VASGTPPLGQHHEVRGRWLWLHRAGAVGLDYWNVHRWAADLTTSVLYDRAGTGWSDRVELPRTQAQPVITKPS